MTLLNRDGFDFVRYEKPTVPPLTKMHSQGVWELVAIEGFNDMTESPDGKLSQNVVYHFKVRRNFSYYLLTLFLPIQTLMILQIIGIEIHPTDSNRSSYAVAITLAFSVTQNSVQVHIPKTLQTVYFSYYLFLHHAWFS